MSATLSGTGIKPLIPALHIDATSWSVATGPGAPVSRTFTIANAGTAATTDALAVHVSGVDLSATSDGCTGTRLAAGASCQVTVTDTATDGVTASIHGGVGAVFTPSSVDFGAIAYGQASFAETFTLVNYGPTPVTLGGATWVTGSSGDQDWFTWRDTCAYKTIGPYGSATDSCTLTTSCAPIPNDGTSSTFGWHWDTGLGNHTSVFWETCAAK